MPENFTWVETHKQLARKLLEYKDKQEELIKILESLGVKIPASLLYFEGKAEFESGLRFMSTKNMEQYFDLSNVDIDYKFEILDVPVRSKIGKIKLKV